MPERPRNDFSGEKLTTQRRLFMHEFRRLGCRFSSRDEIFEVQLGNRRCLLLETETSFTSLLAFRILRNKKLARQFLREAGVQIAPGQTFSKTDRDGALEVVRHLGLAVLKPVDGRKGTGVAVSVTPEIFDEAWAFASAAASGEVLVERCFEHGLEARYFVIEGRCVAVHSRIPPTLWGDGAHTIEELVRDRNVMRLALNPTRRNADIVLDAHRRRLLEARGLTVDTVPALDQRIVVDWKAGISTGGDTENITQDVHESMKVVAESIAQALPGLDVFGVDIIARDHREPASADNHIVIEANTRPGVRGHQFPDFGEPINVCRLVAEHCVRRMHES